MNGSRKHRLIEIEWPVFDECEPPARASVADCFLACPLICEERHAILRSG